jgi:hypothetical protein
LPCGNFGEVINDDGLEISVVILRCLFAGLKSAVPANAQIYHFSFHRQAVFLIPHPRASFAIRGGSASAPPLNAPLLSVRDVDQ